MADGFAMLQQHIERLRSLPKLVEESAPAVAVAIERELGAQIARAETPAGEPWKPTASGSAPLRGAARALRVGAIGSTIIIRITGHHALHHMGIAKGRVKREIIPSKDLPAPMAKAIGDVLRDAFDNHMKSGRAWR